MPPITFDTIAAGMTFDQRRRHELRQLGIWMFLGTVTMLFAAFTSAYLVRRGSLDWTAVTLPSVLWLNTLALVGSTLTLEAARWAARRNRAGAARGAMLATLLLGVGFLVGQLDAWRALADLGVFVPTSPHASFFYILTGVHAVHLSVGLVLLAVALTRLWRASSGELPTWSVTASTAATFWHFFGGVWLYLFLLLSTF